MDEELCSASMEEQKQRKAAFGTPFLTPSEVDDMEKRARVRHHILENVDDEFEAFKRDKDAVFLVEPLKAKYTLTKFLAG